MSGVAQNDSAQHHGPLSALQTYECSNETVKRTSAEVYSPQFLGVSNQLSFASVLITQLRETPVPSYAKRQQLHTFGADCGLLYTLPVNKRVVPCPRLRYHAFARDAGSFDELVRMPTSVARGIQRRPSLVLKMTC